VSSLGLSIEYTKGKCRDGTGKPYRQSGQGDDREGWKADFSYSLPFKELGR